MIVKILLILLGIAVGLLIIFIGYVGLYILMHYLDILEDRIDEYFRERQAEKEREEIERFKKNI